MEAQDFIKLDQAIKDYLRKNEQWNNKKDEILPTGFAALDKLTGGIRRSELVVIGGRPAMGKTALAVNIALNAVKKGKTVLYFSLEVENSHLAQRFLVAESGIRGHKISAGMMNGNAQWQRFSASLKVLAEAHLYIDDQEAISINEIKKQVRKMRERGELDLVIIDYVQLIKGAAAAKEMSKIIDVLFSLTYMYGVPVIVTSQLSRSIESRKNKKDFRASDLRGARELAFKADTVIFLYRDEYYKPLKKSNQVQDMELIVFKHRRTESGPAKLAGTVKLFLDTESGKITDRKEGDING
ncbi:MAG: DnaB-like helicase C-terminal domain-containing protein [bacterium]